MELAPSGISAYMLHLYTPMIDALATSAITKLPLYFSPVPDSAAYAVDVLSCDWKGLSLYIFPPVLVLTTLLRKIAAEPCQVLLIAPFSHPRFSSGTWFTWPQMLPHHYLLCLSYF